MHKCSLPEGVKYGIALLALMTLGACQSSGSGTANSTGEANLSTGSANTAQGTALASTDTNQVALADGQTPGLCSIRLAGGPPPKPTRGADFGQAVVKNTGQTVKRGIVQQIGAQLGGGLGAAVAGGLANATIRNEEDIKGVWMISDGSANCACEVSIDSAFRLNGKGTDTGHSKTRGCSNPDIQKIAAWNLGYSFTGYDSKFQFKASDKQTVIANLNRDGIHYFSGTLVNGTPIVLWRDGQTYNQLAKFK